VTKYLAALLFALGAVLTAAPAAAAGESCSWYGNGDYVETVPDGAASSFGAVCNDGEWSYGVG
jgi:hypothetical protein